MRLLIILLAIATLWSLTHRPRVEDISLAELRQTEIPQSDPSAIRQKMTPIEAYNLIPVQYTAFRPEKTKMSKEEAAYIKAMFDLVNMGVIERVELLNNVQNGRSYKNLVRNHQEIMRRMNALVFPPELERVHLLILNAVLEQSEYFDMLLKTPGRHFKPTDELVVRSDQRLRAAYNELMTRYANEDESTKKSFYSQLCALSFI